MHTEKIDVYQIVTDRIIAQLEQGVIPWKQPWVDNRPRNFVSGKPYRGINILLLASLGYRRNLFLTFTQAKQIGASIKAGEKGNLIVFYKKLVQKDEATGRESTRYYLQYYKVFNIVQCRNLPDRDLSQEHEEPLEPIQACEEILWKYRTCPVVHQRYDAGAFYIPALDEITMPPKAQFHHSVDYYSVLFHELVHSTGHVSRLNRKELVEPTDFASYSYSIEELTAEIGTCFLQSQAGILPEDISNHVGYLAGWLKRLRNNPRLLVYASIQAQKAVDFILNVQKKEEIIPDLESLAA